MSDAKFILALSEIAAMSNNGHTGVFFPWVLEYNRLAVRFYIADDGLFIADAMPEYEHLVGRRVEKLENKTLDELRDIWSHYSTGRQGHRDSSLYIFMESPEALYAENITSSADNVILQLENGEKINIGTIEKWTTPENIPPIRDFDLIDANRINGDPLYLQHLDQRVRLIDLPVYNAIYLQFRGNGEPYEVYRQIQTDITRKKPSHIIVDQRFNWGGNLDNTRELMQAIPAIIAEDGKVIVITSGKTFSAGISSVGYLKQAGGSKVTIIGSPIGDELEFWAEGGGLGFRLPQTKAYVGIAIKRHDYINGCSDGDCHEYMKIHPIAVSSLDPDIQPTRNFEMVINGEDPYFDAAIEQIE